MGFFGGGGGTTPVNMVGASTGTAGTAGYVPAPAAGKNTRYLCADASFGEAPMLPQYKAPSTSINKTYSHITGTNSVFINALRRSFSLVYMPSDGNINKLVFRTGSGTYSVAINFNIALWEVGEDGKPSTYLIGANASSGVASNADIVASVTSTAVKRGFYYISLTPDSNTPTNGVSNNNSMGISASYLGGSSLTASVVMLGYTATVYDQTTHGTIDNTTITYCPNVGYQYV